MPLIECPLEYIIEAISNPELFAQEKLSIPSGSVNPFFREIRKITACIDFNELNPFIEEDYSFHGQWKAANDHPRYMHIDLARNQDAVAISMAHATHMVKVEQIKVDDNNGVYIEEAELPLVKFDFAGRLKPRPHLGEKNFDYKQVIHIMQEIHNRGFNIRSGLITLDRFQSYFLMDTLRNLGFVCGLLSVDHTTRRVIIDYSKDDDIRYESVNRQPSMVMTDFREMVVQERIKFPAIPMFDGSIDWLTKEATEASWNPDKQKVEKMDITGSSDDLLQSVAGAAFNCQNNCTDQSLMVIEKDNKPYVSDEFYKDDTLLDKMDEDGLIEEPDNFGFYGDEFPVYHDVSLRGGIL